MKAALLFALLAVAASPSPAADDTPPLLRHDPFRRPAPPPSATPASGATSSPAPWQPTLRGVLLAGSGALANVDGQMVGIGERIEGHRLVSVSEHQAVFEKDGRRIVLDTRRPLETRP
ncbi:hypothetical protein [Zoogloea sp.]|uniref:hypothetical protein n=1 Tax=Zoogloea sp. TaxID=49181 RepID=UPI00321F8B2B